ncbi:amino acid transporter [Microbacterium sp. zg.Y1090]|uniref:amino acid transporter n=1 Tax=Microbacterium TaxID=33882 RepID=UPI00214B93DC|nr:MULTISPECIES: amino acid transporter [unclassified Microbacterium]MCR2814007.1 amino acid transporter [Microbacterium sp. zg.Y1084]MCR2819281.1 amino acid transporter [Microbacterium sp. zg.Y1090]MDL5487198.1 amino acid transporter [Microbacterium sp. zg-Y1211]WIM28263.1 amino acid transporter [Microbacterium sp. zg-Y1090]
MTEPTRPTRRELLKPVQLLGFAFAAAAFGGLVTLMSMGALQAGPAEDIQRAWVVAAIVAGVSFIATLVVVALLILVVDPAQVTKTIDGPVMRTDRSDAGDAGEAPDGDDKR